MTKGDIVKEYLNKFPNTAKKTLAHIIYDDYPHLFKSIETVRTIIRYYTGANGKVQRKHIPKEDIKMGKLGNPFQLPESYEADYKRITIPEGNNRILLLSDIHIPYHSVEALTLALEYGKQKKVNTVILNGDSIDFYQASRFVKDPRKASLADELQMAREVLKIIHETLSVKIYFKVGNHEERLEQYLFVKAPELLGIEDFKLDSLLRLGELGAEYVDKKRIISAGELNILHGHEFGRSVFSPVNPARGVFMRGKENCIIGHNHQTSEHTEPTMNGKIITTWSTGCLCELNPEYMPLNKWNHGFAYIEHDGEKFNVENKRIYNGKIL